LTLRVIERSAEYSVARRAAAAVLADFAVLA
jgi:hypothetical protein